MKQSFLLIAVLTFHFYSSFGQVDKNYVQQVNPLIGTASDFELSMVTPTLLLECPME